MKKINFIILFLVVSIFVLQLVNIYFINKISTDSIYAGVMRDKIKKYDEENMVIQSEILEYTTITKISSKAEELGFIEAKEFISLYAPLEIAVRK